MGSILTKMYVDKLMRSLVSSKRDYNHNRHICFVVVYLIDFLSNKFIKCSL